MKFDFSVWNEVSHEKTITEAGKLRLLASRPCALYAQAHGVETLVGFGSSWDLETTEAVIFHLDNPKARLFIAAPVSSVIHPDGEVFTNIDRMTEESGPVLEIRRAMRDLEISKRQAIMDIRAASRSDVDVLATPLADPDPVLEDVGDDA